MGQMGRKYKVEIKEYETHKKNNNPYPLFHEVLVVKQPQ
jgi:hypothetical protein